jgi:hypothetical protein
VRPAAAAQLQDAQPLHREPQQQAPHRALQRVNQQRRELPEPAQVQQASAPRALEKRQA